MIHLLLIYDDTDSQLGLYFLKCANDLKDFLYRQKRTYILEELHEKQLHDESLPDIIEKYQAQRFIVAAYSHGSESKLKGYADNDYIILYENTHLFKDSLFYSNACRSGKLIAQDMMKHGCLGFIGYKEAIYASLHFDDFYQCDNYGIKQFFEGDTLSKAYQGMKKNYTDRIDLLYNSDFVLASLLRQSRDALIMLGNPDLIIQDFDHQFTN